MIIPELGIVFVHIQKTGGSSITAALGQPQSDPRKHFTALELRRITGEKAWEESFKFAFVRNPWDRLVSWWSMIEGYRARFEAGKPINTFITTVLRNARSFDEFVRLEQVIADRDGTKSVRRNQVEYVTDETGALIVDFVGRFERLEQDANDALATRLGRPLQIPHVNMSVRTDYRSYYTPELAEEVERLYERDIRAFGYRFDG